MENKINVYTCKKCNKQTITVDLVEGTTPFRIKYESCKGDMTSCFYQWGQNLKPIHEWYCGWKNKEIFLKHRKFVCKSCLIVIDRDYNAALNIKRVGG